jgi:ribosomal protein L11 methyltransferase
MDYLELTVDLTPRDPWTEILIQQLADQGYESFVETTTGVQAYAPVKDIDPNHPLIGTFLANAHPEVTAQSVAKIIPQQNWNAKWESSFDPVVVESYLSIVAPFHDKSSQTGMVVEIEPKMSFGTGHHQTTYLMSKALFELDAIPDRVLDMGTGTGVLAIVAEKLGAKEVLAVDIEDWSVENTIENAARNNCHSIQAVCGDIDVLKSEEPFGLILANINKNVLKAHLPTYSQLLPSGGILLLSGFFDTDVSELLLKAEECALEKMRIFNKDNWAAIQLIKK